MFPDTCERCGLETEDLTDCKKNKISNWFLCPFCMFSISWKQAAKKWFHKGEIAEGLNILHAIALEKQRADADRRLKLLREWHEILVNQKRLSGGWDSYNQDILDRVAKELSDA